MFPYSVKFLSLLWASFVMNPAHAATRTVCLELTFAEARDSLDQNSPLDGDAGALRGRHAQGDPTPAVGHLYELWDKDGASADEKIGTFIKSVDGRGCATFEWEGSSAFAADPESEPDVYVKCINEARSTFLLGDRVRAVDETDSDYPIISWRDGNSGDPDAFVAVDCTAGAPCDILPGSSLAITISTINARAERVNALDTAQRALEYYGQFFDEADGGVIRMVYPCVNGVSPVACAGIAQAVDRDRFYINGTTAALNGRSPAHELGHLLHYNQFDQDSLSFDTTLNGPAFSRTAPEYESLVSLEGWADFVAASSWWDPGNTGSSPVIDSNAIESGAPFASTCSDNTGLVLQATKGFWDLIDSNNEPAVAPAGAADTMDISSIDLAAGWDRFADGMDNREQDEVAAADPDGMNLRDYLANNDGAPNFGSGFFTTVLNHNCMGNQDDL